MENQEDNGFRISFSIFEDQSPHGTEDRTKPKSLLKHFEIQLTERKTTQRKKNMKLQHLFGACVILTFGISVICALAMCTRFLNFVLS